MGSVLSGGNSAPGPLPYAETKAWLEMADKYYNASIDDEDVEIAIPIIWGIDAVHGHANLKGSIIFFILLALSGFHFNHMFTWMADGVSDPNSPNYDQIIAGKTGFLNVPFFLIRAFASKN